MALIRARLVRWAVIGLCVVVSPAAAASADASAAGTAGAAAAPFCCRNASPWRGAAGFRFSRTARLSDVVAISRDDAWAVGSVGARVSRGIAVHWNGKIWRQVPLPLKGFTLVSVSARAGSSAWVFGYQYHPGSLTDEFPAYGLQRAHGTGQVLAGSGTHCTSRAFAASADQPAGTSGSRAHELPTGRSPCNGMELGGGACGSRISRGRAWWRIRRTMSGLPGQLPAATSRWALSRTGMEPAGRVRA